MSKFENLKTDQSVLALPLSRELRPNRESFYTIYGKRMFDIVFALTLLPLLVPIILALAVLVKRDGGPAFFGHLRVGQHGRTFKCWKLRSMRPDAENYLKKYLDENPAARREWEANYKLADDPRITRIGKIIRKTSLDELPQILNVLAGEMSFVGPRPVLKDELLKYGTAQQDYMAGRPGVTGLWQVTLRNDGPYEERVALDVKYRRLENFWGDLKIIFLTPLKILKPTGQ